MYDPTVGRWLSLDPIGFEGNDTNLYRYVGNEPVNRLDSYGLVPSPLTGPLKVYKKVMKEVYKGLPGLVSIGVRNVWAATDHEKTEPQELYRADSLVEAIARSLGWDQYSVPYLFTPSPKQKVFNAVEQLRKDLGECYSVSHRFYGTFTYRKMRYQDDKNFEQICYLLTFRYYSEVTITDNTRKVLHKDSSILIEGVFPLDSNGANIANKVNGKLLY